MSEYDVYPEEDPKNLKITFYPAHGSHQKLVNKESALVYRMHFQCHFLKWLTINEIK